MSGDYTAESINITGKVVYVIVRTVLTKITFTIQRVINLEALSFRYVVIREYTYVVLVYNILSSFNLFYCDVIIPVVITEKFTFNEILYTLTRHTPKNRTNSI